MNNKVPYPNRNTVKLGRKIIFNKVPTDVVVYENQYVQFEGDYVKYEN